jgi:hypothetical protein
MQIYLQQILIIVKILKFQNNSGAFKIRNSCTIMSIIQKYHDFLVMNINSYRNYQILER